jgi:hypothetical protein
VLKSRESLSPPFCISHSQANIKDYNAEGQAKEKHPKYDEHAENIGGASFEPFIF